VKPIAFVAIVVEHTLMERQSHTELLIEYLNDPPAQTRAYEAIRAVAQYFAGRERTIPLEAFMDLAKAHTEFAELTKGAFSKTSPGLGPFTGGEDVSLRERWGNGHSCFFPRNSVLSSDERAALDFFLYIHQEQEDLLLLGKRWRPRLRICAGPRCGRFIFDTSVNRSRRTCSPRCRMARLRAR
jgi:hypothetical protein